jgi:4,5-dihydroxyphthalate decarboxylase
MMLKTLMGDHAVTKQFKTRADKFDFVEVKGSAATFFKRVVRDLEFDVAEMAIMTHLIAKTHGKPYRMLPFVVLARFQHPYLVYNAARGDLKPEDLHGKRVGVRSYSVTTGAWIRRTSSARLPARRSARCCWRARSTPRSCPQYPPTPISSR